MMLRLILSLGLILNGSGYASAAAILHVPRWAPATIVSDTPPVERNAPCPEHGAVTSAHDEGSATSSATQDKDQSEHDKPGCCGSAGCIATCLQHAPTVPVALWIAAVHSIPSVSVAWSDAAHASPPIADPIRPPIA